MASQGDPTQPRRSAPPPQAPPPAQDAGIDLTTLFLSAVASAAAAYVTSKIWAPGTLFSAAMSPVIVALVKEGLRKPTEVVTAAVPAVARPLRTGSTVRGGVMRRRSPGPPVAHPLPEDLPEHLDAGAPPPYPPPQAGAEAGPVRVYSTRGRRLRWRLAVLTGLLGFAICVVVYTLPEVITGKSVGRAGHATTFFPGKAKKKSGSTTPATTSTTDSATTTSTTTTPGAKTTTVPAQTVTETATTPAAPPADTTTTPAAPAPAPAPPTTTTTPAPQQTPPAATTP